MTQTRYQCGGCYREWLYAHNWDGRHCPACGSAAVTRVTYAPVFPGADIATRSEDVAQATPVEEPRVLPFVPPNIALEQTPVSAAALRELALRSLGRPFPPSQTSLSDYVDQLAFFLGEPL